MNALLVGCTDEGRGVTSQSVSSSSNSSGQHGEATGGDESCSIC